MGKLFPTRWKHDGPPSIETFVETFRDDYACAEYLAKKRWPDGFVCPHCGSRKAWRLESRPWLFECAGKKADEDGVLSPCRKQTSVIAGTIMQGTHLPLRKWFLAAYLMATYSNSISALQLQPKLGVSYKTAWLLLHKLRRAMVNPERMRLSGTVDVDESAIPFTYRGIVGDTTQWKKEHIKEIMKMCHPNKRQIVKDLARFYRVHRVEVLDNLVLWVDRLREEEPELFRRYGWDFSGVREFEEPREYMRLKRSKRPVLAPRRPGEERLTGRRYSKPDPLIPRLLALPPLRRSAIALAAE